MLMIVCVLFSREKTFLFFFWPEFDKRCFEEGLETNEITQDMVRKKLSKLDTNKARSPDAIPPMVLKECARYVD